MSSDWFTAGHTRSTRAVIHKQQLDYNNSILSRARGRWPEVLKLSGIDITFLQKKHGPCPICGGKDRFRFDDLEGRGTFFCNHCGAGDGLRLLILFREYSYQEAITELKLLIGNTPPSPTGPRRISTYLPSVTRKILDKQQDILLSSTPVKHGDPIDAYLKQRNIILSAFPSALYYHPALPFYDTTTNKPILIGNFPAMLAPVVNQKEQVVSVHRTYLQDGEKAKVSSPKKLTPSLYPGATQGAAIQLFEPVNGTLAIAEGIETSLAFHLLTNHPVWAAVSARGMETIILPDEVTDVIIAADHDTRGQQAALLLSKRLKATGRTVEIVTPKIEGTDFADCLEDNLK